MERVIAVANETEASFARKTNDGRTVTYRLKVLQQPERARACGSGAKSSADRRPVDPPPIVELRIYEGDKADKDITFQVNANYFLFATLEQARPIAQGRVPQDPARLTVLTGTPVAGMVYLDRPEAAGYFIFPDLSVRHEGKYRLGFSLYEELKDPKDEQPSENPSGRSSETVEAHVTHRLEVKSQPFTVFSAKKFPGLASSTILSRTVAEQGCRVRIRRDVRMRRREKSGKDYDGYSDAGYECGRTTTPDHYPSHPGAHGMVSVGARERSSSIASHASIVASATRRASGQDMTQGYQQTNFLPPPPPSGQAPQAMTPMQPAYSIPPPPQYAQQQYSQQQSSMQAMPVQYQPYQYAQPMHGQPSYHGYASTAAQVPAMPQQYDHQGHMRNASVDYAMAAQQDVRRPSILQPPVYPYGAQQYGCGNGYGSSQATVQSRQASHASTSSTSVPGAMTPHYLPPINVSMQAKDKTDVTPPSSATLHHYDVPKMTHGGEVSQVVEVPPPMVGKRSYDRVFDTRHMNGPLRKGARPMMPYGGGSDMLADDGNDHDLPDISKLNYRRADGREVRRPFPPSIDMDGY